jgi:hypothetical protein
VVDLGSGWVRLLHLTLLTPGLYKTTFDSSSSNGNGLDIRADLTLSGAGVYIFQISDNLEIYRHAKIVLTNGARASDVFWQVGGNAWFMNNSKVVGTVIAAFYITVDAGAQVEGRLIAGRPTGHGIISLHSNIIVFPFPSPPPSPPSPPPPPLPPPPFSPSPPPQPPIIHATVDLGAAQDFTVLAGGQAGQITYKGDTTIGGLLGASRSFEQADGDSEATIFFWPSGSGEAGDDATSEAITDAYAAYDAILGRVDGVVDLGSGWTYFSVPTLLTPGLYKATLLGIGADLTLSGAGVYIFQISGNTRPSLRVSEILAMPLIGNA